MLDGLNTQLSDIESSFHSIAGEISGIILGLGGSAFHQSLLTLLVGIGLILHSFWLFLSIFYVEIEAIPLLSVRN
jgi:hypothetical protein